MGNETEEIVAPKVNTDLLKVGDRLSETQYYIVKDIIGDTVQVQNERGFDFGISKNIIEEGMHTSSQFIREEKVSRTELVDILSKVGDTIFTVNYNKQPQAKDVNEAIALGNKGRIMATKDLQKIVNKAYKGENRTLVGYLINTQTGFGRSQVIDLEIEDGYNVRLVDHRTLNFLISRNVKYIVK